MFGPLPAFFLGALTVLISEDLGFSEALLGSTVAVFFASAALSAAPSGRLSDRIGARPALRLGLAGSVVALATMALSRSWWQLALGLAVAGFGHAVLQVASNLLLTNDVAPRIQGLAFGIKQSAIPAATLIAGASLPIIGTRLGWRWTYGVAAIAATLVFMLQRRWHGLALRRAPGRPAATVIPDAAFTPRELLALAVAVGLAAAAANSLAPFLVAYAVKSDMAVGRAGVLLASASALGLAARVLIGWLADTRGRSEVTWVAGLLVIGGAAFATLPLSTGAAPVIWVAGSLAFAAGWGWPGLFTFIVARENAHEAASATGVTQAGVFVGAVAGPLLFGVAVSSLSYEVAWLGAAAAQFAAALLLLLVRSARRSRLSSGRFGDR